MKKNRNYLKRNFKRKRNDDKITPEKRSLLMSKIRSKNTKFERDFILRLKKTIAIKPRMNVVAIKGKPDIVLQKERVLIFLDSDFWHGWQYPRWKHLLKNDFWRNKIENNRARDVKTTRYLRKNNWKVFRFWEHDIEKNSEKTMDKLVGFLNDQEERAYAVMKRIDPRKCAKRHVVAIIEKNGKYYVGSNWCRNQQKECPRLPDEDYSKCKTICEQDGHAELDAIKNAKGDTKSGIMYLIGHDHCCEPCLAAMKKAGIETVIFNKYPDKYNRRGIN